jgi:hypothetical protein
MIYKPQPKWADYIGQKADVVDGDLVLSEDGFLTISKSIAPYVLLVTDGPAIPICPPEEYRGRPYRFMRADCAKLAAEWTDRNYGTDLLSRLNEITFRNYQDLWRLGYEHVVQELGFTEAPSVAHGDVVFYEYMHHIGVCIDGVKLLHHIQNKFSSLDVLDPAKILKVYRYAH